VFTISNTAYYRATGEPGKINERLKSVLRRRRPNSLLSPYLIRKLGSDAYGVWILAFGLIEYCWLFDLGFRSATVKYHTTLLKNLSLRPGVETVKSVSIP
jgi:hypothetical protein